jgi:hypothetical protein
VHLDHHAPRPTNRHKSQQNSDLCSHDWVGFCPGDGSGTEM